MALTNDLDTPVLGSPARVVPTDATVRALPRAGGRDATVAPAALAAIAREVEVHLAELFRVEGTRWSALDPDLADPLACLEHLVVAGGKRLRPAFAHWGFRCAGGHPTDRAEGQDLLLDAAAALELLQAFALIHDDVMDDADSRRGSPTAHVVFAGRHDREGWRAEARRFGESVAILLGDLAHVWADALVADAPPRARAVWRELSVEVMMGQYLDVLGTARGATSVEQARRIARLKSGRYTIERPLQLGAALAGADDSLLETLSGFGAPLGEAFQLRDDVLGVIGDPEVTGKPVGDDLREGKPTALLALARERATASEHELLDRVGRPDVTDAEVEDMVTVLRDTGALVEIERDIERLTAEATAAIASAPVPGDAARGLIDLAWYLATRQR